MPLLDTDALHPHRTARTRRTAIALAAALAAAPAAAHTDWNATLDDARALWPTTTDHHEWTGNDLDGDTAHLSAADVTVDLTWDRDLQLVAVHVQTYRDAFGTGLRLAIAADTDTEGGPDCLTAHADSADRTIDLQWCSRADRHDPFDMAAFPGKDGDDAWAPDDLLLTQTANLDTDATLIDYYGLGAHTGDAFQTGIWPTGYWPGRDRLPDCTDPDLRLRLPDLHLTDRWDDAAEDRWHTEDVHDPRTAHPTDDRLLMPACVPTPAMGPHESLQLKPFHPDGPIPLAAVAPYRAATDTVHPVRTAIAVDARTCDADLPHCTSDQNHQTWWTPNGGPANTMLGALLESP